jgi:hypothetical protein
MNDPLISIQVADVAVSVFANGFGHGAVAAAFTGTIIDVANVAIKKKSCAFAGRCKLKSTRLCTKNPMHATAR